MKTRPDLWQPLQGLEAWVDARNLGIAFGALADQHRVLILSCLLDEPVLSVSEFQSRLDISQSLASHHLAKLVDAGILQRSKEGRSSVYWITEGALERLSAVLARTDSNDGVNSAR